MTNEFMLLWLRAKRFFYTQALAHLTRVDPCHEDLREVVFKLRQIDEEVCRALDTRTAR